MLEFIVYFNVTLDRRKSKILKDEIQYEYS